MIAASKQRPTCVPSGYVRESDDRFLALFPHRHDYLYAEHPDPGERPQWRTESRHPLSDRLIHQGTYLYGVRFGAETNYCLLDIDAGSTYHPKHDPFAIARITAALEPLGLVSYLRCTSSYSKGLHLYFPFQNAQSSWELAIVVTCLLENAGFKIKPGQLEIFPNPRPYSTDDNLSLYNAHRLPMQAGSYLLDESYQPILSDTDTFARQWELAQDHNDINSKTLKRILKQAKRKHFGITGKANKFLNDLNAEIELGWTGSSQTNRLLGRIAMRSYIFGHVIHGGGGEPLEGDALVHEIVRVAKSLPGYKEWCRHQHEIEQQAEEWARCIEGSRYFHFGKQTQKSKPITAPAQPSTRGKTKEVNPEWNNQLAATTKQRILAAMADLLEKGSFPAQATARLKALRTYRLSPTTLYKYRSLWHPRYLRPSQSNNYTPPAPSLEDRDLEQPEPGQRETLHTIDNNKLVPLDAAPQGQASEHLIAGGCGGLSTASNLPHPIAPPEQSKVSPQLKLCLLLCLLRYHLDAIKQSQNLLDPETPQLKAAKQNQAYRDKMQRWMDTGNPILAAEGERHFRTQPSPLPSTSHLATEASPSPLQPQEKLNPIEPFLDRVLVELLAEVRLQASRMQWSDRELHQYITDRFSGKHESQLAYDQLILLLLELRRLE